MTENDNNTETDDADDLRERIDALAEDHPTAGPDHDHAGTVERHDPPESETPTLDEQLTAMTADLSPTNRAHLAAAERARERERKNGTEESTLELTPAEASILDALTGRWDDPALLLEDLA